MFFPLNFQLEELDSNRRHQVMLAAAATANPIMEMHLSLAALYQDSASALACASPPPDRNVIGRIKLVAGERRSSGR